MRFSLLLISFVTSFCLGCAALGQQSGELPQKKLVSQETREAVQKGLKYLADRQLDDGSFGTSGYSRNVAVCALAGLAFQASGSTPRRGPYAANINRCLDYLLENTNEAGFIAAPDAMSRGPMYGHGFALLFLCESYGMSDNPRLRDTISKAVDVIVRAQNPEGGWRYQPVPDDADISVTVCQMMALRAARNSGIAVPQKTIELGLDYVKDCQNEDGGFRYMFGPSEQPSQFARSAAALVAILHAGEYDGDHLANGLAYVERFEPGSTVEREPSYYYYAHYYAAQAMWHVGGERWQSWYPSISDQLLARQRADGSWLASICPEYGTAMACIVLQVPNNALPILQR